VNANPVHRWWLPLSLVTLSGLLQFGIPATAHWLRYEPAMIHSFEVWRLLGAHFVHLNWRHYVMNAVALLAISALYATASGVLAWRICASAAAVSLGLLWFNPTLAWYVGMSGILHGLLVAGSLRACLARNVSGALMLLAVIGKLIWEQINGPVPVSEAAAGGRIIVDAHLYGALGGVIALCVETIFARWTGRR